MTQMQTITIHGVTLSAGAVLNGHPSPRRVLLAPGAGDFADRSEGRARRIERRHVRAAKHAFLYS